MGKAWRAVKCWLCGLPLPCFELFLDVGLVKIHTRMMTKAYERRTFEYIQLVLTVLRWTWAFDLYRPYSHRWAENCPYRSKETQ